MLSVERCTRERGGHVVVAPRGELGAVHVVNAAAVVGAGAARGQCVTVDLAALEFIDCRASGAPLRARELARRPGVDVLLAAPQETVLRVLGLAGWRIWPCAGGCADD